MLGRDLLSALRLTRQPRNCPCFYFTRYVINFLCGFGDAWENVCAKPRLIVVEGLANLNPKVYARGTFCLGRHTQACLQQLISLSFPLTMPIGLEIILRSSSHTCHKLPVDSLQLLPHANSADPVGNCKLAW